MDEFTFLYEAKINVQSACNSLLILGFKGVISFVLQIPKQTLLAYGINCPYCWLIVIYIVASSTEHDKKNLTILYKQSVPE